MLFLKACFDEIGEEYSYDENEKVLNENPLIKLWTEIPLIYKLILLGLYILLWIFNPGLAWYITLLIITAGKAKSGMGGGSFGGGGSRS